MEKETKKLAKQKPKRQVKQKPQKVTKAMRTFMVKNGSEKNMLKAAACSAWTFHTSFT